MDRPLIVLQDVGVEHPRPDRPPIIALVGINLELRAGESVAVYGPNGSGKSTLLRVMAGLEKPTGGRVSIFDLDAREHDLPVDLRRRIGFVFQNPEDVFAAETVAGEVKFTLECHRAAAVADDEVRAVLTTAELAALAERPLHQLSGGEKQHVALASVLAVKPEIIFFDEPTSNLDPLARRRFFEHPVFTTRERSRTTVLVTQYWQEAAGCDRLLVLEHGRVIHDGPPLAWQSSGQASSFAQPEPSRTPGAAPLPAEWLEAVHAPQSDPLVVVNKLTQTTSVFSGDVSHPLRDVSFILRPGECMGVVGPTGAGKSTLAYHLAGLIPRFSGRVSVAGRELNSSGAMSDRPPMALLFQNPEHHVFAETVAQDVAFGPRNVGFPKARLDPHVVRCLDLAGLPAAEFGTRSPFEISAGEQRKAALAGMLALPAALYIFDEPTAYLDRESIARLASLFPALAEAGKAVMVITHNLPFLWQVCPRWIILDQGKLVYDGPRTALEENPEPLRVIGFF